MNNFEATLLVTPDITKDNLNKIAENFENSIVEQGGSVVAKEDCGLKSLAYKIKNLKKAFYLFYQIEILGDKIQSIKKNLSINESIIRHLLIKVDKHDELPTKLLESNE